MGQLVWSIIAAIGGFVVIGGVFYYWIARDREREDEEAAREFFDRHGHWPDEPPA